MAATKDTTNNRIQLNEGTRASPKSIAQVVTDINDTTWIESLQDGAIVLVKRSVWFNGFWLEYPNYVTVIFLSDCHPLMHTTGSGVIHRMYSRWSTSQTTAQFQIGPQALRDGTTFVMETDKDGSKGHIRSAGNRYDYPTTFLISGTNYATPKYEISGGTFSGSPNSTSSNFCKLRGSTDSVFANMTFVGDHMFEVFPGNTCADFRSTSPSPSYINAGASGTVQLTRWRINRPSNYSLGGWVDSNFACVAQIDDLANDGVGVWDGTFNYSSTPGNITTILRHSLNYNFASGTTPISGIKVAIVNTATAGTAQAQTVLTSNAQGVASGFAVRAQGTGNTVSLRQQQRVFARGLAHDVSHAQLTLRELTAPVVATVQGVLSSLYGASEVVSGAVLTKCSFNYTTKTITVSQTMPASELFDSARWSLYQDANISQPDFTAASTAAVRSFGDWVIVLTNGATVTGVYTDANSAGEIRVQLTSLTDTVQMRKASDNSLIATRTGAGSFAVAPALVGLSVYFERRSGANLVMSTISTPVTLTAGVNAAVPLYAGAEVQVAQAGRIEILPTLAEIEASTVLAKQATLTTLATTNQAEHDATQTAIAALPTPPSAATITSAVRADLERTGGMLDTLPTLSEMEGSWKLTNGGLIDLPAVLIIEDDTRFFLNYSLLAAPPFTQAPVMTIRNNDGSDAWGFGATTGVLSNGYYIFARTTTGQIADGPFHAVFTVNGDVVARASALPYGPTMRDIEASTVLAKQTDVAAIKAKTDNLPASPAAVGSAMTLTSAYDAAKTAAPTAAAIRAEIDSNSTKLDVAVGTRLATTGYTAPPTVAAIRADIERTGGMLDTVPTLSEIEASTVLAKQSGFTGLATAANVTAAQTAIVTEVNANETKIDAVKADTAAIKAKTDTLSSAPTAAAIRAEMETAGGKLDETLKTAKKVRIQTL